MKFRKKPIVIEAEQFFPDKEPWPKGVEKGSLHRYPLMDYFVETLEGVFAATPGDWIITGVKGERYPCKPDIFDATYDEVTP